MFNSNYAASDKVNKVNMNQYSLRKKLDLLLVDAEKHRKCKKGLETQVNG